MAVRKTPVRTSTPSAPEESTGVALRCEDLGKTEVYTPDHAAALLAYQERHGLAGSGSWQPVAATESTETA